MSTIVGNENNYYIKKGLIKLKKNIVASLFILGCSIIFLGCSNSLKAKNETINYNTSSINNNSNYESETSTYTASDCPNKIKDESSPSQLNYNTASNNTDLKSEFEKLLNDIKNKALDGCVINSNFKLGTTIATVTSELGEPSSVDYVVDAKGTYFTFNSYDLSFGCNSGEQIFEIRSLSNDLGILNLNSVKNFFGNPDYNIQTKLGEIIIGYKLTDNFKILFVFDIETFTLKHYSILYPTLTKNSRIDDNGREW